MMNNKSDKMTYVVALNAAIECEALSAEVREKLTALRDQQAKRNAADKKPTKTQQANEDIKTRLMEAMEDQEKLTVSEIQTLSEELAAMSNQKVAALVRQLVKEEKLVRLEEGRKAYFKVA